MNLINKGINTSPTGDIIVKDKEGRQSLNFNNSKDLAE